jgi:magnesium transporter
VTSLRQLLLAPPDAALGDIAQREVIAVHTTTDQEEVAQLAARYDLLAIPVIDDEGLLAGIVTVDDIVDIVQGEATEDVYKMAGTSEDELIYQERPLRLARLRLPWLLVNMVGLMLTGLLLEHFQLALQQALFLLTFVPVIMGMAGSSGTQTSMITVRGLATGRIGSSGGVPHFLWQQLKTGAFLGLALGLLAAAVAFPLERNLAFPLVVGLSLFIAIVVASLNGVLIPALFERLGVDPAVAAGPLVTASNDVLGILIYFGTASLMIGWLIA